ncbi:uncharacterized protein F5Z01DRAFT_104772 [Emericellopsis atlantica]|uniref:AB hydrolase-1 domain-containing protein n=1 Tax=Emericellopsis atlantica TaxID=2614577 RepID=A0A9P8CPS1_9HYPO|nr:uncharacterized protein F5Z01DRAFT_104772 [Emericellopsis atlantica]KAG9254415.1 hypothetical protein F5Z01DRAFT_104772 [Emericellopsis atlantica]
MASPPLPTDAPSIPTRTRFNSTTTHGASSSSRRRSVQGGAVGSAKRQSIPPAGGPEVISSLITSLSGISKPADDYFEGKHATSGGYTPSVTHSSPASPSGGSRSALTGSFGVDYGAYSKPSLPNLREEALSLDEIAASAPVIRTSKPTSGYSPLSPPKTPRSHSSRENNGGLRSFMRSSSTPSRPSTHDHDDSQSIGNLSIERHSTSDQPDLHRRRSADSWGRKASRSAKGLMYMSSKERLRERGSGTGLGSDKPDPFLAETPISEEPIETMSKTDSPRPIPHRDSSLRPKRSSGRKPSVDDGRKPRRTPAKLELHEGRSFFLGPDEHDPTAATPRSKQFLESIRDDYLAFDAHTPGREETGDGAPFPAVPQSKRRSEQSLESGSRRRSAPQSPDGKPKRSNSRLARLSRQSSPEPRTMLDLDDGAPLDRVDSADSIDDAVDSYLCSPRLSQKIKHPQTGRVICFSEVGDPEGSAVFCCVGMGLTRYITAFYDELALTLKLRLITPDRPGVGDSEPYPDGTTVPLNWPDDVYAICQSLKITKFSILAHSAGAIYALATALRMPQHIRGRIHLLAPWIPPSQMNVFGGSQILPPTHAIPTSQRILRALPTPMLKVANSSFMSATSTSITTSLPKNSRRTKRRSTGQVKEIPPGNNRNITPALDKENVPLETTGRAQSMTTSPKQRTEPLRPSSADRAQTAALDAMADQERQVTYDTRLTHAIWELATTGANPAVDLLICLERRHTIGFRYVDINRPVTIHHGSRDTRVPVDNVRWLGKTMRRCEVRVLEGEGHGLMASATVMGNVLMEISKEWEDWMRVTGADGRKEKERGRRGTIRGWAEGNRD